MEVQRYRVFELSARAVMSYAVEENGIYKYDLDAAAVDHCLVSSATHEQDSNALFFQILSEIHGGRYKETVTEDVSEELSEIIDKARKVEGQTQRSRYYKQALDLVMELAVELPTYQRNDLYAYNANKIDKSSLTPDSGLSAFFGLTTNIHNVSLVVEK